MNYKQIGNAGENSLVFPKPSNKYTGVFRSYWSSPESWAAACANIDRKQCWEDSAWEKGNPDWYGTERFEDAIPLAQNGWHEGIDKVSRVTNLIKAEYPIRLKPIAYGIAGSHPNVPRAISGNPASMYLPDKTKANRRNIITLLSEMGASCGHSGDEFINRAAVVAAILDAIEAHGYACDVITYSNSNSYKGHNAFHSCQVKNANQPVDISRLSFGLGHPSMFRRFAFAEKCLNDNMNLGYGLGHTASFDVPNPVLNEKNIFILKGINDTTAFKTEQSAKTEGVQYIIDGLKAQGFPLWKE